MRDGITLRKAGHPTLVLVHDVFELAARAQAKELQMPELRIYQYPQSRKIDPQAVEAEKASRVVEALPHLLQR